jgi:UDP-N-acetylglucosamine acyltransferase
MNQTVNKIHPTSVVDASAQIGSDVEIGPFCVIGPNVTLGDGCRVISHAVIHYTALGPRCVVYPQASLGLEPQHLKYKGEKTRVEVGSDTIFREGVTVHRGTALDKSVTRIGSNCFFMALSHIAHDCVIGDNVIMANAAQLAGHVEVGENTFISTTVGIHQFVRVGKGALVSGGAMVPLDVVPFSIAQGDRATLKGLNLIGMKRSGIDRESIRIIKEAYKVVFLSKLSLAQALAQRALHINNPHLTAFRDFLTQSKRGFLRPSLKFKSEIRQEEPVS